MKSLTTSTILMLVASSLIFFFIGRFTAPTGDSHDVVAKANTDKMTPKGDVSKKDETIALNDDAAKKEAESKEKAAADAKAMADKEAAENAAAEEAAKKRVEPAAPIAAPNALVLSRTKMGISDKKIGEILSSISQNLENKQLAYVSSLMQDCSGIFHQLKDSLQTRLPSLAEGSQFQYPSVSVARSSRQIADWYHKNNNLLIVQDPLKSKNSIRPGSVMFYGKSGQKFNNITIDMLTDRNNNYTSNGAIQHIAVVTAVTVDENGDVVDYTIMHGRRPGRHAKRTGSKEVQSPNRTLPAFGHWKQQWVGIANMATAK